MKQVYDEIPSELRGFDFDKILKETFYNATCDYRNLDIKIFVENIEAKIIKVSNDLKTLSIEIERKKEDIMSELDINILKNAVISIQKDLEEVQNDLKAIKENIANSETAVKTLEEKVDTDKAELTKSISDTKQELQTNIDNEKTEREQAITQVNERVKTLEEKANPTEEAEEHA